MFLLCSKEPSCWQFLRNEAHAESLPSLLREQSATVTARTLDIFTDHANSIFTEQVLSGRKEERDKDVVRGSFAPPFVAAEA